MASWTPNDSNSPQARIAEMRRAERARDRRNAAIAVTASVAVAAGLIGFGAWVMIDKKEKRRPRRRPARPR